ncbi:oxidoreductase [Asticcacaulis sp. YBE204]|uniref:oxidoreductase n=1 Tax=Asticcacaulis sp. YBE204 TaxID=1282363 RepID=UPI0003C3E9F6|nr:oxidoreductase [Asticcacaulis sp. YBE204]ESQ79951.1 hypothetical protein AEYBE204_08880 [Asticcacaulis sp. YBE204]
MSHDLLEPEDQAHRVWFITGTSQGFGHELTRIALERGDFVVATSRTPDAVRAAFADHAHALVALEMDVNDATAIQAAVATALHCFGHIDILVNNAGFGLLGAIEEATDAETRALFDINLFGLLGVTRAILPHMRARRQGHIVNLSSIAGLVGSAGWGLYNASKFAVEGLSEALAQELRPLGIGVTVIEPGPFRTDFLGGSLGATQRIIDDYEVSAGQARLYRDTNHGVQAGDPALGAEAMFNAVTSANPPLHLVLGQGAYERAVKKLETLQAELKAWRTVSFSTDKAA